MLNLKEGNYFGKYLDARENELFKLSLTAHSPDSVLEDHYHDNSYISVLTSGSYLENIDGSTQLVQASDVLFRPTSWCHQNTFLEDSATCFNIEFKKGWQERLDWDVELPNTHIHFNKTAFPSLYKLLLNFKIDYNADLSTELILDWLCTISLNQVRVHSKTWVEKVERILKHELAQFHSLASLSERIHVHPIYMARAFKAEKGMTIGEFQLKSKLHNAVYLLSSTQQSISDISFANGFFDDAHFIRSFKMAYGISPNRFRKVLNS
ncbi:helix-turn-helix domain-containing protein [Flagellimonas algicola]|uniref:Helix-turn-helix domain-containing protein n=1 Tax=Flagellimonas algicola TaxID=2583815 RepID=A0ABY2WHY8_9FLAO|nr:helix-turn-helix domain-containing protein [Allomuricauda algicola]TMU51005.1 helix-turn-helix domain-containing protein [Allomuricauda algicola]